MSEIDESNKNEIKHRTKENLELRHLLNAKTCEIDEQVSKLEKQMNVKMFSIKSQVDDSMAALKEDVNKQIDKVLDDKMPDVDGRLNDMSAKMSLGKFDKFKSLVFFS